MDDDSSEELVRRAREGDRPAQEDLLRRYLPRLRRWASGRLPAWARDFVDTDDMIQETLVRTMNRLANFEQRGEGAFQAYVRQALHHRIADELRRASRRPGTRELNEDDRAGGASPLEEAIGREALGAYERALERIEEEERAAIVARVEMGLGYEEIARCLGKSSPDAARMAVSRALVRLAREMDHGPA